MKVLLYSDETDPVVKAVRARPGNTVFVSVAQLLDESTIDDEITNGRAVIRWTFPEGRKVTNDQNTWLINRVLKLDDRLFSSFHPDDRDYAYQEFYAYLMFALEAFPRRINQPGPYGLGGNVFPIPYQWEFVKKHFSELQVASYYAGPRHLCPYPNPSADWTEKDMYALYDWKAGAKSSTAETFFYHACPKGVPVLVLVAGKRRLVTKLAREASLSQKVLDRLSLIAGQLAQKLEYDLAEVLFFVDGERVSFGMISPLLWGGRDVAGFNDFIRSYLGEKSRA